MRPKDLSLREDQNLEIPGAYLQMNEESHPWEVAGQALLKDLEDETLSYIVDVWWKFKTEKVRCTQVHVPLSPEIADWYDKVYKVIWFLHPKMDCIVWCAIRGISWP